MAHDDYPIAESKTSYQGDLKTQLLTSINAGKLNEFIALRVADPEEVVLGDEATVFGNVADVLQPPKDIQIVRWQNNELDSTEEQRTLLLNIADEFGLRLPVGHELPIVQRPLLIIESGANRTSVVRRSLAEQMLVRKGGLMYQFGSPDRLIPPTRTDKNGNEIENPEYKAVNASDICGDLGGATVTEFEVNVASAVSAGYEIIDDSDEGALTLVKEETVLVIVKAGTFKAGLELLASKKALDNRNVVIATNGQYRTKDKLQAEQVMRQQNVTPSSITAIGDETGARSETVYANELATLLRILNRV